MRRAAKIDANQAEIVKALRKIGCTVKSLAAVGEGCPDLLVGFNGQNYAIEVKDGKAIPSKRRLTEDEERFHREWRGQVAVVTSVEEAIAVVTRKGAA